MDSVLNDCLEIRLEKSDCLVLLELLARSSETWLKFNTSDDAANPMNVEARELSERRALWHLECALERTIPEIFSANYEELVRQAKRKIEAEG
jgi:hypothetical protein